MSAETEIVEALTQLRRLESWLVSPSRNDDGSVNVESLESNIAAQYCDVRTADYIASCGPSNIKELLADLDAEREDAAKSERRARMLSSALHNNILAMQSAFIDYSLTDPQAGMQWIFNTLIGPGQLPNIDVARAIGGAQAWFDAETAKEAARLAAIDAAMLAAGEKP